MFAPTAATASYAEAVIKHRRRELVAAAERHRLIADTHRHAHRDPDTAATANTAKRLPRWSDRVRCRRQRVIT